ncbi:MAG TPA: hypothetical protein PKA32_00850, partial [Candidatus Gracilibacteria bacterium]|nr:hypothetical protein [Candidatus Gracilibacteria bacterium]
THTMNAESVVDEYRLADFDDLGDGSVGLVFNDTVNGDAYQDDIWVNVNVESAMMTEEDKIESAKALIEMVLVSL